MPMNRSPICSISVVSGCRAPRGRRSHGSVTSTRSSAEHAPGCSSAASLRGARRSRLDRLAGRVDPGAGVGLRGRRQRADLPAGQRHRRRGRRGARLAARPARAVGRVGERLLRGGDGVVERRRVEQRDLLRVVRIIAIGHRLSGMDAVRPRCTHGQRAKSNGGAARPLPAGAGAARMKGQIRGPPTPAGLVNECIHAFTARSNSFGRGTNRPCYRVTERRRRAE